MTDYLWLVPALPFLGAVLLVLFGRAMSRPAATIVGVGSVGAAAVITLVLGGTFMGQHDLVIRQTLWQWISVADFSPAIGLRLDALSMVFIFVITFVGTLIHVYSVEFMAHDEGFPRFFTYLNLFVGSMLVLVLADNLVLMYLGWEGVGLCSFLLIGFWYSDPKNGDAARKAFVVTRVGDTAMAIGLFILFDKFRTLQIEDILSQAPTVLSPGEYLPTLICLLLLGGAVGKSAQLPLQTWLPDAMAGPSPVSALIHAATMVTAGVYLIARMHGLYELSPVAMESVAVVGAVTLLLAGFSALTQFDLKRVLAYSTISQIGYMFLALGVGAWSAAIFHFMIHAFFKALLFLAAGAVIVAMHHEHDMFKMGGLRTKLPAIYWTFLIGAAALAAFPFVSAGFYSKDAILWYALAGERGNAWFFAAALLGAFITSLYTFRMVFVTFFGPSKMEVGHPVGRTMTTPLLVLAALSVVGGFIELPHTMGHVQLFSSFLESVLPATSVAEGMDSIEWLIQLVSIVLSLAGIYIAYHFYIRKPILSDQLKARIPALYYLWLKGWGFDILYDTLLVRPFVALSKWNKMDFVDRLYALIVDLTTILSRFFAAAQTGVLRWYLMSIVIGALLLLTLGLMS
jgi:NADH-quinone oxidoreductase subunit L